MGVQLGSVVYREQINLNDLRGKTLAVDASSIIHQFLALVRYPTGVPLMDEEGHVTSSLAGLFYRSTKLIYRYGIGLVFVFDGRPHPLKFSWMTSEEKQKRRERFEKTLQEWKEALERGDLRTAFSKAVTTGMIDSDIIEDAKKLLFLLGIPTVQAPAEAEAQASYMARKGHAWAVNSRDFDCLLFGAPRMARYVSIAGVYRGVAMPSRPEVIELKENLARLRITHSQLTDMAILMGTDYNRGVKGIGPRTALSLVRTYGRIERMPAKIRDALPGDLDSIREVFKNPPVERDYTMVSGEFDPEAVVSFLCGERGFSESSVTPVLRRMQRSSKGGRQLTLESFA